MDASYIKFNGGIWSDVLKGRHDLDNYVTASRTCCNFIPTRYGQVEKRSGTQHLGFAKHDDKVAVLHEFQFSVNTKFFLEFGDQYVRFWSNDLQVDTTPSAWVTSTAYVIGDTVTDSGTTYYCAEAHTSGTFATDLAASKWYALEDNILEVVTPYLEAELYELQLRRINDVVYITHPDHPVGKLTRLGDDNWTYAEAPLSLPYVNPDVDSTGVTLTPSANTGSITLTASDDVFDSSYIGSKIRMRVKRPAVTKEMTADWAASHSTYYPGGADPVTFFPGNVYLEGKKVVSLPASQYYYYTCIQDFDATTAWVTAASHPIDELVKISTVKYVCVQENGTDTTEYEPGVTSGWEAYWKVITTPADVPTYFEAGVILMQAVETLGEWTFKTSGTWSGTYIVERSTDGGTTYETAEILTSNSDANYNVTDTEDEEDTFVRVKLVDIDGFSEYIYYNVKSTSEYGVVEITGVTDTVTATATVDGTLSQTTVSLSWQESGFSPRQGYPRAISLFDNRLLLAGTAKKPQGFFYSGIAEYEDFLGGTLADSPFFVETLSEDQSTVQWVSAQRELFTGTASVEGVLLTRKNEEAQSAENLPIVRWHESMGSAHRPALQLRDSLLVLQRGMTTINLLSYALDKDGYTGEEVSLLCPHLFSSGVLQMVGVREPYTGVYCVTGDGNVVHMIYEPRLQVTGWCEYSTQGGEFESIQTLSGSGDEDDIWCVVKRTVNGTTRRHIEKFTTGNRQKQQDRDSHNIWHVDAGVKATGTDMASMSGLDHLEGEEVVALCDGIMETHTVASGAITFDKTCDTAIAGLAVTSEFEPLDLEAQGTFGKRKQLFQTKLMVWRSLGGEIASDGKDYEGIEYHTAGEAMDTTVPLLDGFREVAHESNYKRHKYFRVKHSEPYPFTLQAVVQTFKSTSK